MINHKQEKKISPFCKAEGAPPIRDRIQLIMCGERVYGMTEIPTIVRELCLALKNCMIEQDQFGAFFQFLMRRETFDSLSLTPILKLFSKPKALSILSSLVPLVGAQFDLRGFLGNPEVGTFASLVQAIHTGEKLACGIHPRYLHCRYSLLLATLNNPSSFFASEQAKRMSVSEQKMLRQHCFLRILGMYAAAVSETNSASPSKDKKHYPKTVQSLKTLVHKDANFLFTYLMNMEQEPLVEEIMRGLDEAFHLCGQTMPTSSPVDLDCRTEAGSSPSIFQALWIVHCKHQPLMYKTVAENRFFMETTLSTCMSWSVFPLLLSHFAATDNQNQEILSNFTSIYPAVYLHIFSFLHGFVPALPKIIRYMSSANYQPRMTNWLLTHCTNKETEICNGFAGLLLTPMALQQYIRMYELCVVHNSPLVLQCPTSNEWRDTVPQSIRHWLADTHMSVARPEDMPTYTVFFDKVESFLIDMNTWMYKNVRNLGSIPLWVYEKDLPRAHCENADLYYDRVLPAMRTETRAEYIGCSCKSCGFELQKPAVRPSLESTKFFSLNASTSKKMHTLYDALENQVAQICTENNVSMDGLLQKDMKDIKKTITNLSKACQELFHSSTGVFVGCKTMALPESSSSSSKTKELDHKDEQTIVQTSRVRKNNRTANTTASEYKEEAKVQIPSRVRTKRRHAIVHIDTEQKDAQEEKQVKNTRVDHAAAAAAAVVSSKKSFGSCFICQKEVFDTHSFLSVQCPQHKYYLHRSCRKGICLQGEKSKCLDSKCVYMVTRIESKPVGKSTYIEYENNNVRKYSNNPHIVEVVHLDTIKPQDKKILRDGSILPVERRRRKLGKLQDEEEKIDERNQMNSSSARCKGVLPMLFVSNQDYNEEPKHCHSHYLINNPSDQCFMHHPLCNLRSILCVQ